MYRDEFIGAATLFVPLNRRFQIGLTVPFVDSLQSTDVLPSATSFGDVVITPQLMLDQTETRDIFLFSLPFKPLPVKRVPGMEKQS